MINDEFEYDKNGNPIFRKKTDGKNIRYYYDSLDRLTKIEGYDYILEFGYDAFNRRIFKKVSKYFYSSLGWKETDFRYFLYDDQNEIGSFDKNLSQIELRILSDSEDAEIGSIAFEIGNEIYAPIYDISGNVVSLILTGNLKEHYRYSVFGEKKVYTNEISSYKTSVYNLIYSNPNEYLSSQINNPWQFSSKRLDEESGLVYYGRRYYDPQIGRWLTCDPMGFEDGLNLYAFVLNDPLIKYDLYGLYALPGMFYGLDFSDKALKGFTSGMWNFGTKTLTGIAGNNDDFIHWNINRDLQRYHQREISRDYINNFSRDWFTNKIHADVNNRVFQNVEKWTERGLNAATLYYSAKSAFNLIKPDFSRQLQSLKQFSSKPQLDLLSGRNLYSGIDVERIIKDIKGITNNKILPESRVSHIFRNSEGHFIHDNLMNRKTLINVSNDPKAFLGKDVLGNYWFAKQNYEGSQIWVQVRNNKIINGGINMKPKKFNPKTGLSKFK